MHVCVVNKSWNLGNVILILLHIQFYVFLHVQPILKCKSQISLAVINGQNLENMKDKAKKSQILCVFVPPVPTQ